MSSITEYLEDAVEKSKAGKRMGRGSSGEASLRRWGTGQGTVFQAEGTAAAKEHQEQPEGQ